MMLETLGLGDLLPLPLLPPIGGVLVMSGVVRVGLPENNNTEPGGVVEGLVPCDSVAVGVAVGDTVDVTVSVTVGVAVGITVVMVTDAAE